MALILFKLALFFYLLGTVGYIIYLVSQKKPLAQDAYGVLWAGFLAHTLAIGRLYYQTGYFPVHNLRESLSFFAWAIMGAYLVIQIRFNTPGTGLFPVPPGGGHDDQFLLPAGPGRNGKPAPAQSSGWCCTW